MKDPSNISSDDCDAKQDEAYEKGHQRDDGCPAGDRDLEKEVLD